MQPMSHLILTKIWKSLACMCDEHGSVDDECDATTGKCTCKENFANDKCSECIEGFFGFPNCQGKYLSIYSYAG